jgi:hypothetical protein
VALLEDQTVGAQVVVAEALGLLHRVLEVLPAMRVVAVQTQVIHLPVVAEVVGVQQEQALEAVVVEALAVKQLR